MSRLSSKLSEAVETFPFKDVTVCLNRALAAERDRLMGELAAVQSENRMRKDTKALREQIDAVTARMQDSLVTVRITGVPYAEYQRWLNANPPRKGKQELFNVDTFFTYAAKRSASIVDGEVVEQITPEEWDLLDEKLINSDFNAIAAAVLEVNNQGVPGFLLTASARTAASPVTSESHSPQE